MSIKKDPQVLPWGVSLPNGLVVPDNHQFGGELLLNGLD